MVSTSIVDSDNLKGYLSLPKKKSGKGLLLLHAWWGLNDFFKTLTNRFAGEGFVAFAPDYYNGRVATTVDEANNLVRKFDKKEAEAIHKNALDYLKQHPSIIGEKIGVLGVSLGTRYAVNLARKRPNDIGAIVLFYGVVGGKFDGFRIPIQGHFAEEDEWGADPKAVKKFETRLGDGAFQFYIYQGTTHWFLEEDVTEAYHQPSAELAFRRTLAFLKSHL
jgi:carboxymethylenebutenolidase